MSITDKLKEKLGEAADKVKEGLDKVKPGDRAAEQAGQRKVDVDGIMPDENVVDPNRKPDLGGKIKDAGGAVKDAAKDLKDKIRRE